MKHPDGCFPEIGLAIQPFVAIQLNHFTRLRYYLKNGLDPNLQDLQRRTLLMSACELQSQERGLKFVNLLLKYQARLEDVDSKGRNALHFAVLNGHDRIVARFLELAGDFNVNTKDTEGNTALMYGVLGEDVGITEQIIKTLRKYDLSVDVPNNHGITPLIQATILGLTEIANCLIAVGKASEQIRDKHFRKTASEWKRKPEQGITPGYPKETRVVRSCPVRGKRNYFSTEIPRTFHSANINQQAPCYPTTPRIIRSSPQQSGEYSRTSLSTGHIPDEIPDNYRYPDLRQAYGLYQEELASSYRKGVPPRVKTPPPAISDSSGEENLWTKMSLRFRQRRHTIALTQSLPNNLSTRLLFSRRSVSNRATAKQSLSFVVPKGENVGGELPKWPSLKRRNSIRRQSDSRLPLTAPADIESSSFAKAAGQIKRRHSVSFQSLTIHHENSLLQSPRRTRRSSLKTDEGALGNASIVQANQPILEQEEDLEDPHSII